MAGLNPTPEMLEAAYELLRTTLPYRRWKLPHADDVEFRVTNSAEYCGRIYYPGENHGTTRIEVSAKHVHYMHELVEVMAHEMVHLRQTLLRPGSSAYGHKKDFRDMAKQVCRHHGFNPSTF